MTKNKKSRDIDDTIWPTPYFFPLQNVGPNYFHKIGKFKKFYQGKIELLKNKDKMLENICLSLGALLPWQRPIAKN